MAMIPKYAYRVIVSKKLGESLTLESHNYETLPGAWAFREIALGQQRTCKVEVVAVLDVSTPSHRDEGVVNHRRPRHEIAPSFNDGQRAAWRLADRR
jgi:hypothetical protein